MWGCIILKELLKALLTTVINTFSYVWLKKSQELIQLLPAVQGDMLQEISHLTYFIMSFLKLIFIKTTYQPYACAEICELQDDVMCVMQ